MAQLLIVDNDERIVELTSWFLRKLGHEVETANSFAEARELLARKAPDLMLADLDLGRESGQEELPKLAAEGQLPPTLVVSGFLDSALDRELRAIPGVLATVTKPVDLARLNQQIHECLADAKDVLVPQPPPVDHPVVRPSVPAPSLGGSSLAHEELADDEGWVEIAPLAPGVDPAPPTHAPWTVSEAPGEPTP
jgi:DNA-binding response OmpR family regulator